MPISIRDFKENIIGKIKEKFDIKEDRKKHHVYYWILYEGRPILRTKCSHGSGGKEIGDNILSEIRRQLVFDSRKQLMDFEDCKMKAEEYFDLVIEKQKNVISD